MKLSDKVAIITGATGDIGKATAKKFVSEGAKVMLAGRSDEKLTNLQQELGDSAHKLAGDISSETYVKALIDEALSRFDHVSIMFANAGAEGRTATLEDQTVEDFVDLLNVNVIGVWLCIKHSIEVMRTNEGDSSIIVTSSGAGVLGYAGAGPYIASKHAVRGLTEALRDLYMAYERHWVAALEAAGDDPVQQLVALVQADFDAQVCNPEILSIWFAFWGEQKFTPQYAAVTREFDVRRQGAVKAIFNDLLPNDPERSVNIAEWIETLTDGYWQHLHLFPEQSRKEEMLEGSCRFLGAQLPEYRDAIFACAGLACKSLRKVGKHPLLKPENVEFFGHQSALGEL